MRSILGGLISGLLLASSIGCQCHCNSVPQAPIGDSVSMGGTQVMWGTSDPYAIGGGGCSGGMCGGGEMMYGMAGGGSGCSGGGCACAACTGQGSGPRCNRASALWQGHCLEGSCGIESCHGGEGCGGCGMGGHVRGLVAGAACGCGCGGGGCGASFAMEGGCGLESVGDCGCGCGGAACGGLAGGHMIGGGGCLGGAGGCAPGAGGCVGGQCGRGGFAPAGIGGGGCGPAGCVGGGCALCGGGGLIGAADHAKQAAAMRVASNPHVAQFLQNTAQRCENGSCGGGPPGPVQGSVNYPYYTTRGPRDFFHPNPPSIGP